MYADRAPLSPLSPLSLSSLTLHVSAFRPTSSEVKPISRAVLRTMAS